MHLKKIDTFLQFSIGEFNFYLHSRAKKGVVGECINLTFFRHVVRVYSFQYVRHVRYVT